MCYQALYSTGGLTFKGQPTGVIFGVLVKLFRLFSDLPHSEIAVAWDSPASNRKKVYPGYKQRRRQNLTPEKKKLLEDGFAQFNLLRDEILPSLGLVNQWSKNGYEADDVIAQHSLAGSPCTIVSSDSDLWQMIRPHVKCYTPSGDWMTMEKLKAMGVKAPMDWAMVKAIMGCKGDDVPGIDGVGEKWALRFIYSDMPKTDQAQTLEQRIRSQWVPVVERNLKLVRLPFLGSPSYRPSPVKGDVDTFEKICELYGLTSLAGRGKDWVAVLEDRGGVTPGLISPSRQKQRSLRGSLLSRLNKPRTN